MHNYPFAAAGMIAVFLQVLYNIIPCLFNRMLFFDSILAKILNILFKLKQGIGHERKEKTQFCIRKAHQ